MNTCLNSFGFLPKKKKGFMLVCRRKFWYIGGTYQNLGLNISHCTIHGLVETRKKKTGNDKLWQGLPTVPNRHQKSTIYRQWVSVIQLKALKRCLLQILFHISSTVMIYSTPWVNMWYLKCICNLKGLGRLKNSTGIKNYCSDWLTETNNDRSLNSQNTEVVKQPYCNHIFHFQCEK